VVEPVHDALQERWVRDSNDVAPRKEWESVDEEAEEEDQQPSADDLTADRSFIVASFSPRR
jgi:hypothetical protein